MKSISIRFALASVSVALVILILTGIVKYFFIKKELVIDAREKVELIVENSRYRIDELTSSAEEEVTRAINTFKSTGFDEQTMRTTLARTVQDNPSIYAMAVAFEPQLAITAPPCLYASRNEENRALTGPASPQYNCREKKWYSGARSSEQALWSAPCLDEGGSNELMASYSNPFFREGKFAGVVSVGISLAKLSETIASIQVLDSGYSFLLSREGTILVHPDSSMVMQRYESDLLVQEQMIKMEDEWVYYGSLEGTGWTLAIIIPHNELLGSLHQMTLISMILAMAGAILLIITMFLVSRRISSPLKEVAAVADEISQGNFERRVTVPESRDEVYQLSIAVNRMQTAIKNYIEDLKLATAKEERIASELAIARSIQMNMLPRPYPKDHSIVIETLLEPAKAVGGDFYDFFQLDEDRLCFIIADVSGKGVPAALFMAVAISTIRAFSSTLSTPSQIVEKLNNTISANNDASMFISLVVGILEISSGQLQYLNAGHPPPFVITSEGRVVPLACAVDPVVGVFEGTVYHNHDLPLQDGEQLFLYTDGVNESFSSEDEPFGEQRLLHLLKQCAEKSPKMTIDHVREGVKAFCGECEQSDDITMLVVRHDCHQQQDTPATPLEGFSRS
ncbi:SpoIIE family protein phosphatase [Desulfogranum mediterraneum]|uniref:SpoIIE family protein phosphatase n=1 Tax=Desulfogranum mediterraneum TaxID=160661 RepID=UPI0004012F20|nr:SpoIIE family protein phosphatase [Desulfogranum mediterraneum]